MQKKIQDTDTTQHNSSVPPENRPMNKNMIRSVVCSLLAVILFAWALMNFDIIMKFFNKVISLFSPFLIGGGIAFLINVVLNPLERCWNKVCKKAPAKLTRPVCLTLSSVLVLGILFAVIFMMIPSLWKSVDEFIQNIPIYVEEIRHWWMDTVRFAAKYNIVLPEYAIDSDLLIRKITALIDVLLAFIFALYLLAKKEVVAAHLKKLIVTILPQKKAKQLLSIASLTNHTFSSFVSGQLTEAVIIGILCFLGMLILKLPYAGAISTFVAFTALIPVFGAWLGGGLGAFLILLADPIKAVWFIIYLLLLQQVEGNLIYPKVVGKSVGLPGLLVLLAVTVGGEAFGILGMLFSVPVCAVLYNLYLAFMKNQTPRKG